MNTTDESKKWSNGNGDITIGGTAYKTLKNSNGIQNTITCPDGKVATSVTFYVVANADTDATLSECDGTSYTDKVTSHKDYSNPIVITKSISNKNSFTFTFKDKQVCFVAVVTCENAYTITYNTNGFGGTIETTMGAALPNPLPSPTFAGTVVENGNGFAWNGAYPTEFLGWFTDAEFTQAAVAGAAITENTTLYAKWSGDNVVRLAYNANGGEGDVPATTVHTKNANVTVAGQGDLTHTGYNFANWSLTKTDQTGNYAEGGTINLNTNRTLYAIWTPQTYHIKYREAENDATITLEPSIHTYGTETTLGIPTKNGYTFEGWYDNKALTGLPITVLGATDYTADITVYAKWIKANESLDCGGWDAQQSTRHILGTGQSMHVTFHNQSKGTANYHNWILSAGTNVENNHDYMSLRADVWDNNGDANSTRKLQQNGELLTESGWNTFVADMAAGADVDIKVANSGSKLYVHAVTTAGGNTYTYTAETQVQSHDNVYIALMGEQCTLTDIEFSEPTTAHSITATAGTDCSSVEMTNELGMAVSNGTYVPSGEKITFKANPADGKVFKSWNVGEDVVSENNPSTIDVTYPVFVTAICGEPEATDATVTSVKVAGTEYVSTLNDNVFTASNYYGDPTIDVTLSDGTHPVVSKTNGNSMGNRTASFTVGATTYTINYKQQNVSTKDLTVLSDKEATTWNFKTSLTRPSYIIGDWTWNNMTITSSEEKYIELNSGGIISYTGDKSAHTFSIKVPGPGTLTINGHASRSRYFDVENVNGEVVSTVTMNTTSNHDWTADYNGPATTLNFYLRADDVLRIEYIKWTPAQPITTIEIPSAITVHVGEEHRFTADNEIVFKNSGDVVSSSELGNFTKTWTVTDGSSYINLENKTRTEGKVRGAKSNTSDNATAKVKLTVAGVESNECTVTIVRTQLAVRADHVALSNSVTTARKLNAVVYNPYSREVIDFKLDNKKTDKYKLSAVPTYNESSVATYADNALTPKENAPISLEYWTVTATPVDALNDYYTAGSSTIEVTCSNYFYAYNDGKPATQPTPREVVDKDNALALTYFAGHNPAGCLEAAGKPYAAWGTDNRKSQEGQINIADVLVDRNDEQVYTPYARIHGWQGILNVANPKMNSLTEQHSPKTISGYNDASNENFTYHQYAYVGDHDEFNVPVMGSFYRFYPEKKGRMIVYLYPNGQLDDGDARDLVTSIKKNNTEKSLNFNDKRTYFLDAYANPVTPLSAQIQPSTVINPGFFYLNPNRVGNMENFTKCVEALLTNWTGWGNLESMKPMQDGKESSNSINDVDWNKFQKLADDPVGIFHQPIFNEDGSVTVIFKAYVKFVVNVEPGEVYYVSPTGTKTRMAGVEFVDDAPNLEVTNVNFYNGVNTAQTDEGEYTLDAAAKGGNGFDAGFDKNVTMTADKYYNVTLADRKFKAGQWYTFCMPFDVPEKQIHDIFGEDAVTIHFDNVREEGTGEDKTINMNFWSHFYDQIRAGRPIMIKMPATFPNGATELTNVTFQRVKYNPVNPESLFMKDGNWTFMGTYTPVTMQPNAVIVNNQNFYHYMTTAKTLAGNRAWIQGPANSQAPVVTSIRLFNSNEEEATGIEAVLSEMGFNVVKTTDKIYNLNGQMVGQGADINNLPKGVYIVNGKKQIVK